MGIRRIDQKIFEQMASPPQIDILGGKTTQVLLLRRQEEVFQSTKEHTGKWELKPNM